MTTGRLLEGITVLDFTQMVASSLCSRILADFGAEIIKVERYPLGDLLRSYKLHTVGKSNQYVLNMNAGKKSLCLDFYKPEAIQILKDLVPHVDVVMEGFVPGQMKKYGLDYESLFQIKPDIVYVSMSGFGQYGPYRDWVSFASAAESMAGMVHVTGQPDGHPQLCASGVGDPIAATHGCLATLASLIYRMHTGIGQHVDTAMVDSLMFMDIVCLPQVVTSNPQADPGRFGRHHDYFVPYGIYNCQREYVFLQALGKGKGSMWARLCHAIDRPEMITDPRYEDNENRLEHRDNVIDILQDWLDKQPGAAKASRYLQKHRVVCVPVLSPRQVALGPQIKERELTTRIFHPDVGAEAAIMVTPYKFSQTPIQVTSGAPLLGQHNEETLRSYLAYTEEQIKDLYEREIIYQDPRAAEVNAGGMI